MILPQQPIVSVVVFVAKAGIHNMDSLKGLAISLAFLLLESVVRLIVGTKFSALQKLSCKIFYFHSLNIFACAGFIDNAVAKRLSFSSVLCRPKINISLTPLLFKSSLIRFALAFEYVQIKWIHAPNYIFLYMSKQ